MERQETLQPYLDRIRELHKDCKGNLVRVHEELIRDWQQDKTDLEIAYSTLTDFCRRNRIGVKPKHSGEYTFLPGQEMQHDTSPHKVVVGGKTRDLQCASLVLGHSRMIFIQVYETFNRFFAKVFLTDALKYFEGAAKRCTVDNTSVVVARGTGRNATIAPEMVALADRFGFTFIPHEIGDKNRSARVERPFRYVENNFYPGRTFADLKDLNAQAITWCERSNNRYRPHLKAAPIDLFRTESEALEPLPEYIPEPYEIAHRTVSLDGYVSLHGSRYSAPDDYISREVRVLEKKRTVEIHHKHEIVAVHERLERGVRGHSRISGHRHHGHWAKKAKQSSTHTEEKTLASASDELATLVQAIKKKHGKRSTTAIQKLHRLFINYPTDALIIATRKALGYGMYDIGRLESIVLENIAGDFFLFPIGQDPQEDLDE